jgi:thioredoxin 2
MTANAQTLHRHLVCPHCRSVNRAPAQRPAAEARCGACHQALFTGHAVAVTEAEFNVHLGRNDIPVLVDMWAPWCGPCKQMGPQFEAAAARLEPHMRLVKLNVDEAQATANRYNVRGIPALLLFQHAKLLGQMAGLQKADAIASWARSTALAVH